MALKVKGKGKGRQFV